jgi:membrane protease YdiL (CAAX protease family)
MGMNWASGLITAVGLAYVGLVMYLANHAETARVTPGALRWMLYGIPTLLFLLALMLFQLAFRAGVPDTEFAKIDPYAALATFVFIIVVTIFCVQIVAGAPRVLRLLRRISARGSYDPDSPVHNTAAVLMLALVALSTGAFVLGGGLSGFAQDLQTNGIAPTEPAFVAALEVTAAFLGVGLSIRRTLSESLKRLGLRVPTSEDVTMGVGIGIGLYVFTLGFGIVWQRLTPPSQLEQQTQASQQLALSFDTLPLAVLLSAASGIGEEILMRGALQPVFGLVTTSVFFALLHTQYLITPGLLLIFGISLGLGWLRLRHSTTAAVIAHFVYNFIQLALLVLAPSVAR